MLENASFHRLMMYINILFVLTNALFIMVLPEPTINFVCGMLSLCGAFSSYIMIRRLEE